ncbi:IS66 family insertion sequence element accessory protein TnpA [Ralstonia sp.]|uniref:IS66 family insertion sequence element accessory protein TnpA n=1 Tax=Ralstonia sp. TaxID=54061 RepID=UPI0039795641
MSKQRRSRQRWRELVDEQRASGLSVDAFCKRHGLATSTFFNWARRFKTEAPSEAEQASPDVADFVEFEAPPVPRTTAAEASPIELVLPSGLVLRVRHGFDRRVLKQVVEALA